jgi:hypothetical protein
MDRPNPSAVGFAGHLGGGTDAGGQAVLVCVIEGIFDAGGGIGADMAPIAEALAHEPNWVGGGGVDRRDGCAMRFGISGPRPKDFTRSGGPPFPKRVGGGAGNARAACTTRFAI